MGEGYPQAVSSRKSRKLSTEKQRIKVTVQPVAGRAKQTKETGSGLTFKHFAKNKGVRPLFSLLSVIPLFRFSVTPLFSPTSPESRASACSTEHKQRGEHNFLLCFCCGYIKLGNLTMSAITFDTLKFANRLKAAGVSDKQAEAEAEVLAEVLEVNLKDLSTKADLLAVKVELQQEMKLLEQRLIIKLGSLIALSIGLVAALVKLL
jgi:hypothetical protein